MKRNLRLLRNILFVSFLCSSLHQHLFAQNAPPGSPRVTGTVRDENGKPLEGVTVSVRGGTARTTTAPDGRFSIVANANAVLSVSYIGFTSQDITVNGRSSLGDISMKNDAGKLDEVVVVGYGSSKKRDVTGAISTFDAKGIEERPVTRVDQALIGQMPGVQVKQQTSLPGTGFSIQVRGAGSITAGTEPLYVIDGFPLDVVSQNSAGGFTSNPLNNLNPDDIESIQVLKDAAAGAIYGSRAANGVVIITTKRGQIGKPKIFVNANTGTSQVAKKMDVLSPTEWTAMATELENYKWVNSAAGRTADQTNAQRRTILGLGATAYNTAFMPDDRWSLPGHPGLEYVNWQDSVFRNAPFQNYELSASGGSDAVRYFISGNYLNQAGVILNTGYKNYSARANVEITASSKFKIGMNLAPSYSETNIPNAEGKDNQLHHLYNMIPVVEDTAGMNSGAGKNSIYGWANSSVSPVAYLNNSIGLIKTTRTLYTLYGEYQLMPGLSLRTTLNYDDANAETKKYVSDFVAGNITNYLTAPGKSSSGSYAGVKKQNFVNENTISFNKTIAMKHSISAVAGVSYNYVHTESFSLATAGGFANDLISSLNNAIASSAGVTVTGTSSESNNTLFSYYGRVQYGYEGKYLLSASMRRDASSRFGSNYQWGTFPSLSVGWRISQEPFMSNIRFINDLKLRASYGKSGNNNIGDYASVPTLTNAGYSFGGITPISVAGQNPSGLANPSLHWETSNTYDLGVDAAVLHSRINITFDVYQKKNTDLLLNIPVPAATGFVSTLENIGAVTNKGLELGVSSVNIVTRNFRWTTNANIAFNHNEVTDLGPNATVINISAAYAGNPPYLLQKGMPMYSYFLIKTNGILTDADVSSAKVAKLAKEATGDAKYVDVNGDGVIDASDRVVAGQPTPKYTWGITNTISYKGFDLSVQIYGQNGGTIYNFLGRATDNPANGTATTLGVWRDRWTAANQNYNAPRGKIGETYTIPLFTTDWLYSSDFWRIQNITLGYNLKGVIKTNVISGARAYISLLNWFSNDRYSGGVNPEAQNTSVSGSGSYPIPGDYGAAPLNRTIVFGINFTL